MLGACVLMTWIVSTLVWDNMYKAAEERAYSSMDEIVNRAEYLMEQSKVQVANMLPIVEQYVNNPAKRAFVETITELFVMENPWAVTAKLGFLPEALGKIDSSYCAYISYRDSLGRVKTSKLTKREDYATWDWFVRAKKSGVSDWSEPFYNHSHSLIVNSYSCPIYRTGTKELIAIWAADVEFMELNNLVKSHLPYPNAYAYIVSNEGRFMAHPDASCELKTFDEIKPTLQTDDSRQIYELMMSQAEGVQEMMAGGERCLVFHFPIETMDASMAIVCPYSDVFASADLVWNSIWNILPIALVLIVMTIMALIYWLMRPLQGFATAVRAVAHGKYDLPLPEVRGHDELRDFHDAMLYMQQSLQRNIRQLTETTAANARIESELSFARQIQQSLLPTEFSPFSNWPKLHLYATLKPARAVGGDLYDFFIRDSKLFFVIADVSGKGIPASLFMAMVCKLFRVLADKEDSPAAIVSQINRTLAKQNSENMFVTMFLGVLDLETSSLCYTNAGHNPPILCGAASCRFMDNDSVSLPVAVFEDTVYFEHRRTLGPDEFLLLYTDGVVEAENCAEELFGDDRLVNFAVSHYGADVSELVEQLHSAVDNFAAGNEQSDDITILALGTDLAFGSGETLLISNNINEINRLRVFVDTLAQHYPISAERLSMLNLALEELVVNIINYSHPSDGLNLEPYICRLSVIADGSKLRFTLVDSGQAFDPTQVEDINPNTPASERQIGGLGIFIARQVFEKISYIRQSDCNITTLDFSVTPAASDN